MILLNRLLLLLLDESRVLVVWRLLHVGIVVRGAVDAVGGVDVGDRADLPRLIIRN